MENNLTLSLNLDGVNLILEALAEKPYSKVANLISQIHNQATEQLAPKAKKSAPSAPPTKSFKVVGEEDAD